jgi:hypothetical protein
MLLDVFGMVDKYENLNKSNLSFLEDSKQVIDKNINNMGKKNSINNVENLVLNNWELYHKNNSNLKDLGVYENKKKEYSGGVEEEFGRDYINKKDMDFDLSEYFEDLLFNKTLNIIGSLEQPYEEFDNFNASSLNQLPLYFEKNIIYGENDDDLLNNEYYDVKNNIDNSQQSDEMYSNTERLFIPSNSIHIDLEEAQEITDLKDTTSGNYLDDVSLDNFNNNSDTSTSLYNDNLSEISDYENVINSKDNSYYSKIKSKVLIEGIPIDTYSPSGYGNDFLSGFNSEDYSENQNRTETINSINSNNVTYSKSNILDIYKNNYISGISNSSYNFYDISYDFDNENRLYKFLQQNNLNFSRKLSINTILARNYYESRFKNIDSASISDDSFNNVIENKLI